MTECELCNQGDPSIPVKCWCCRGTFHLHQCQLNQVPEELVIVADCPNCGTPNCWLRKGRGVICSGPVIYEGQPIADLRGER